MNYQQSAHNVYPSALPKATLPEGTSPGTTRPPAPAPDILQLQASANLSVAQTNESQQRQVSMQQEIVQWLQKELHGRFEEVQNRETRLYQQQQEVMAQKAQSEATVKEAQQHKETALAERSKADAARAQAEQARTEAKVARDNAAEEKAEAEKARNEAVQIRTQLDASFAWPPTLDGQAWAEWRNSLRSQLESDWRAALLLSRLQVVASLLRAPEFDKAVFQALYDLGQSACTFAPQKAKELADALTQSSKSEFEIALPRINDTVDRVWMKAPTSTGRVARLLGWCVKDKLGTVQFHALVD